jgi:hypothetical protein
MGVEEGKLKGRNREEKWEKSSWETDRQGKSEKMGERAAKTLY